MGQTQVYSCEYMKQTLFLYYHILIIYYYFPYKQLQTQFCPTLALFRVLEILQHQDTFCKFYSYFNEQCARYKCHFVKLRWKILQNYITNVFRQRTVRVFGVWRPTLLGSRVSRAQSQIAQRLVKSEAGAPAQLFYPSALSHQRDPVFLFLLQLPSKRPCQYNRTELGIKDLILASRVLLERKICPNLSLLLFQKVSY